MRKSREETAKTRQRIVETASAEFRNTGIDGTGLAEFMSAAGLTHGGFYKHFDSKDQVVEESIAYAVEWLRRALQTDMQDSSGSRALNNAISNFLSVEHRDDPAGGCPFVALASELARGSDRVKQAATTGLLRVVDVLASKLEDMPPAAAKKKALVMFSTMVGALTMARLVSDPDLSAQILRQARKHLTESSAS